MCARHLAASEAARLQLSRADETSVFVPGLRVDERQQPIDLECELTRSALERLSQPVNHSQLLVQRVLGYLSASRHGLAENEILEILFADPEYKMKLKEDNKRNHHELPPNAKRIPIALWSRLRFDLAPYLAERAAPGANVLTFYHRQVAEWVQEHCMTASDLNWCPIKA